MKEKYFYLCTYISCDMHSKRLQSTDVYINKAENIYYVENNDKLLLNYIIIKENIYELLKCGSIIQITNDDYEYNVIVGNITYEGARLEKEIFCVIDEENGVNLIDVLNNIDKEIEKNRDVKKKLYKKKVGGIYE